MAFGAEANVAAGDDCDCGDGVVADYAFRFLLDGDAFVEVSVDYVEFVASAKNV